MVQKQLQKSILFTVIGLWTLLLPQISMAVDQCERDCKGCSGADTCDRCIKQCRGGGGTGTTIPEPSTLMFIALAGGVIVTNKFVRRKR